jgi:hypothetical protein
MYNGLDHDAIGITRRKHFQKLSQEPRIGRWSRARFFLTSIEFAMPPFLAKGAVGIKRDSLRYVGGESASLHVATVFVQMLINSSDVVCARNKANDRELGKATTEGAAMISANGPTCGQILGAFIDQILNTLYEIVLIT